MKASIVVSEIRITKQGEIRLFEIRLPKNIKRIVAVGTDVTMESGMSADPAGSSIFETQWDINSNPLVGRLILQSMERANIFFYDQVWSIYYTDGISDLDAVDTINAFTLLTKSEPKKVDVPCKSTIVYGLFKDALGDGYDADMIYRIKVLLWVEIEDKGEEK